MKRMCDCVEKIKQEMPEEFLEKIDPNRYHGIEMAFMLDGSSPTYSNYVYYKKGIQKEYTTSVIHSFCPFCGKEYEHEKKEGVNELS